MMMFSVLKAVFLAFVVNFCVDTTSSRKPKFVFNDESDTSESSSDESNDSTGDDSDDSNEDDNSEHNGPHGRMGNGTPTPPQIKPWSAVSKVKSTPCAKKEYTFQELFGFGRMRAAYVDFRVCPSHVLYFLPVEG